MSKERSQSIFPEGTVTFLFTDIEGSTELLKQLGDGYVTLLSEQRDILRDTFSHWNGREVDTQGDAFFYSFPRATQAVSAAVDAQGALTSHAWPEGVEVRVRMGLHTGEPLTWNEGYVGMDVHRAARIAHVGHGGQVLLSATTAPLVRGELPAGVALLTLGRHRLKDMKYPERITQLVINDLPSEFPPLTSLEALPSDDPLSLKSAHLPAFLEEAEAEPQPPVFVARERELEVLNSYLQNAVEGMGGVVFVTGGPGRGKTALLEAFGRQAIDRYPDLLVVGGECSAYRGIGDPYLPFRRMMAMLTGDVEAEWTSGAINREDALRLWNTMPSTARMIVEYGPDLINVFVSGRDLMARVNTAVDVSSSWQERLGKLVERDRVGALDIEQRNLFEQVQHTLRSIVADHPLLIILDDMQWADGASLNLLFHLGRRLEGERILIVGAYRPEEVALGRGDGPHPLEKVLAEFKRQFGELEVDLGKTKANESRHFVDAFIDSERNRLSTEFRAALFAHTEGHPLFTVELLRNLQERGDIAQDPDGEWVEKGELDWSVLPARVEGVIEERIGRLEDELKETLTVASVEGVDFTAQIVARVREVKERALVRQLSQELDKKHRLVQEHGILEILKHRLYQYRFRHQLFQQHLYNGLGDFERTELHREVGSILEDVYGDRAREIAPQLAYHFTEAGDSERALEYLILAGDQARMIYAHTEAIGYYQRALVILEEMNDSVGMAPLHLKLGLVHTASFQHDEARGSYKKAFELWEPAFKFKDGKQWIAPSKTMRFAIAEPMSFDPGIMTDDMSTFIARQLFEGLVTLDTDYNVLPAAAMRWDVTEDGTRYTFQLREGLFWSDGKPLTAVDFEFAWKRNLRLADQSPAVNQLYGIKNARAYVEGGTVSLDEVGIRALDDLALEIQLSSPMAYFPYLLTLPITYPQPKWAIGGDHRSWMTPEKMIVNGPYQLVGWESGKKLNLELNPNYLGDFSGNIRTIECPFIHDFPDALQAFSESSFDGVSMITADPETVATAQRKFGEDLVFTPQHSTFFLVFRNDLSPFDDIRVRRAFTFAIDRVALSEETSRGLYLPGNSGMIPPGLPGHTKDLGLPFDPEEARNMLQRSGYQSPSDFPTLELLFTGGSTFDPVVTFLLNSWRDHLDIKVKGCSVEWTEFTRRRDHDPPHMSLMGYIADFPDPDDMLRKPFHSTEGDDLPRWRNNTFDSLIDQATHTVDPTKRITLYKEADRLLVREEVAVMPLGYAQGRTLVKPNLRVPRMAPYLMQFKEMVLGEEADERL